MPVSTQKPGTVSTGGYDGTEPFPVDLAETEAESPTGRPRLQTTLAALIVVLPFVGLAVAVWMLSTCARHGIGPHQIDLSAGLIRIFERLGWATAVHWPAPERPRNVSGESRP